MNDHTIDLRTGKVVNPKGPRPRQKGTHENARERRIAQRQEIELLLKYGWSQAEIAEQWGVSRQRINHLLHYDD